MKKALKQIERYYTALKADVMLSEMSNEERQKRIEEIRQQEVQAKKQAEQNFKELQTIQKEVREFSKMLGVDAKEGCLLLVLQEIRRVHWHLDQMFQG